MKETQRQLAGTSTQTPVRSVWEIDRQLATQDCTPSSIIVRATFCHLSFYDVNLWSRIVIILLSGCDGRHIYRRAFISPSVAAAHRGNRTQLKPKVRLSSGNVHTFPCICLKCRSTVLTIRLSHANNSRVHIYPWSSLHPGFNVLHYPNNRVGKLWEIPH